MSADKDRVADPRQCPPPPPFGQEGVRVWFNSSVSIPPQRNDGGFQVVSLVSQAEEDARGEKVFGGNSF